MGIETIEKLENSFYIKLAEGFSIMALFSVYFDEKDEKIKKLIESNYEDHMFIHDGYCLVKANVTYWEHFREIRNLECRNKRVFLGSNT